MTTTIRPLSTMVLIGLSETNTIGYYDLRYEGEPLPPVTALASNPLAVCTGTFSKTIAPGLRVGYLYAQPRCITFFKWQTSVSMERTVSTRIRSCHSPR